MNQINVKKFALASGFTGAIIYLTCFIIMSLLPKETLIKLANLIFHGIDFSEDIRMNIPIAETLLGIVASFIIWGIVGYLLGFIYNKLK
ncbi:MAG TPA: hypothetical protein ENK46_14000 [Flavobacteriia bacterium]|nr:hypothetical protein [Flavobacteriia bacterium]